MIHRGNGLRVGFGAKQDYHILQAITSFLPIPVSEN
jgi:hypothetical protein